MTQLIAYFGTAAEGRGKHQSYTLKVIWAKTDKKGQTSCNFFRLSEQWMSLSQSVIQQFHLKWCQRAMWALPFHGNLKKASACYLFFCMISLCFFIFEWQIDKWQIEGLWVSASSLQYRLSELITNLWYYARMAFILENSLNSWAKDNEIFFNEATKCMYCTLVRGYSFFFIGFFWIPFGFKIP